MRHLSKLNVIDQDFEDQAKGKLSFAYATICCLQWQLLGLVLPRAAMIAFNYSQTFLIAATISYLEKPLDQHITTHANGLIGAAVLVYLGIALATVNYNRKLYRMGTMFRGATASIIYTAALSSDSGYNQMTAVTLMSTDIDTLWRSMQHVIDFWARLLEVGIGIWLLWRQLGTVAIAPIITTVLCVGLQVWLSKKTGSRQGKWVEAIQRRVGIASTVLRSMKSIKLAGLVHSMNDLLHNERVRELNLAKSFRAITTWNNVVSNAPGLLNALVVFAGYSIRAKLRNEPPLSTAQAFTSLAIIGLLTEPLCFLLVVIFSVAGATGCYHRVQNFLTSRGLTERRIFHEQSRMRDTSVFDIGMSKEEKSPTQLDRVLSISGLVLGSTTEARDTNEPVKFEAQEGTVTMILGPVGSGKSTLLNAILGEQALKEAVVKVDTPIIGYCSQTPWLQNSSVRDNIIGCGTYDADWYQSVIHICTLGPDLAQMPEQDSTIVGSRGVVLSGGQKHRIALARALYSRCSILILDDFLGSLDRKTQRLLAHQLFSKNRHAQLLRTTIVLVTHITCFAHLSDQLVVLSATGSMEYHGAPASWISSHNDLASCQDYDIPEVQFANNPQHKEDAFVDVVERVVPTSTDQSRQTGDVTTWLYYGKSIGSPLILSAVSLIVAAVFCQNFQGIWLKLNTGPSLNVKKFIGVYALLAAVGFVAQGLVIGQLLVVIAPRSAIYLHKILLQATLKAPMSFFDVTDTSVLLNRFSQDMSLIDMQLPLASFQVAIQFVACLMAIALIAIGSNYMAATIPFTIFSLYWIQRFYLRTSRQIRLLDLESKSPLYKHFTETIEGITTIRAFGWQKKFDETAIRYLDYSQRPYYVLFCIQQWLALTLDLLVAILATTLIALALRVPTRSSPGSLGVALTSVLLFNASSQGLIKTWTDAETSLGSVARTKSFAEETPVEDDADDAVDPGSDWPQGGVQVSKLKVIYGETTALDEISFTIKPGQKFAIVGRTGSGKSTLLSTIMRLIDPTSGTITIDGQDITNIPRNTVRDRLICLPQDALIFPGTFRFNLVPDSRITETSLILSALQRVNLLTLVEQRGGIDAEITPDSLSHGEQQLLALARAILRKDLARGRCILILDEATSNLDGATEGLMKKVIEEEFLGVTVVVVAHRLDSVGDADVVLVLEGGKVGKMGAPGEVLSLL
ncbi:hypothetical protein Vi05172_g1477 [Venturia inaequalis]|nr:hypothetical protein Vi05172_g1477 [Venturia inaequalis]